MAVILSASHHPVALAQVDPRTFVLNLYFLLGIAIVAAVVVVVILALWTASNMRRRKQRMARLREEYRAERFAPDGQPLPPSAPGLCDRCGRPFEKVYYLPSGLRRCPDCYDPAGDAPPQDATENPQQGRRKEPP